MTFVESVRCVLTKYGTLDGRACRSEFWWFFLFLQLVGIVASVLDATLGTVVGNGVGIIDLVSRIALFVPSFAVTVRRLHDAGWSGWWLLTILPPIVFVFLRGDEGSNGFGPDPLAALHGGSAESASGG